MPTSDYTPPKTSGIYRITCTANGKIYIGSSINLRARRWDHFYKLKKGKHKNPILQAAFNKYGESYFEFSVLELCGIDVLLAREQHYIDALLPKFNVCKVAGNTLGHRHGKESRDKISKANAGKLIGRTLSVETKQRMSQSQKGRKKPTLCKAVEQISLKTGEIVATHESLSAASLSTGINYLNIVRVANSYMRKSPHGKGLYPAKSAGGYGWRFVIEDEWEAFYREFTPFLSSRFLTDSL